MKRGLKLNEYGVYRKNEWIAGKTEKDVYACLQLAISNRNCAKIRVSWRLRRKDACRIW